MYQQGVIDHLRMLQHSVNYKLLDLEARSCRMNAIFHHIPFHRNENCFTAVRDYLYYDLRMSYESVDNLQFIRAHRLNGSYNGGSALPMIVCFAHGEDYDDVLRNANAQNLSSELTQDLPLQIRYAQSSLAELPP